MAPFVVTHQHAAERCPAQDPYMGEARLTSTPDTMRIRKRTVEHTFGTLKAWMGCWR
jgi:hypothetical protein